MGMSSIKTIARTSPRPTPRPMMVFLGCAVRLEEWRLIDELEGSDGDVIVTMF
jgi:hypothetical protein